MHDTHASENNNNTLKKDAKALLKLVNTYVKVQVIKNCSYTGFVHSIDPVTYSIILSIPQEDTCQIVIIPGHAVSDVTEEELPANVKPPQQKQTQIVSDDVIIKRKTKLMSWFKLNLLPVTESDNKIILGNVTVLPPYNTTDLCADNAIVTMQIQKIMEKMPEDFEPK